MSSRRLLGVSAAAVCALALGSGTAAAGTTTPPRDQLQSFVCQKALDPPARAVTVQSVMRPLTGTSKMQMKFSLLRSTKAHPHYMTVHGRGLGSWISPTNPTLGQQSGDVWIVNHPVVQLSAPATYKFRVAYRWIGSDGQTLGTATQTSSQCYQPELRADLLVRSLSVTPITSGPSSGEWAYTALVANRGLTGAGPVEVEFASGASAPVPATVAWVGAKSSIRQRFVAPPCASGSPLTVTVDPNQSIDEYDYANNALTIACPAAPAS
jgi:CARDB